ncbi:MAG: dihydrofolate reductase, partial [Muribaculaceae bacterium]|nr:dihydrofolate reductase [Muribaculaceae bacterium]
MMINIIVAATLDGAIGLNGDMLYYIRTDLQRFKALTTGHTVVMGR